MTGSAQDSRIYKLSWWRRALAISALVFFCLMSGVFWGIVPFGGRGLAIVMIAFFGLLALSAGVLVAHAFKTAVILTADRIVVRNLWGTKTLSFDQIRGLRRFSQPVPSEGDAPDIWHFTIEPNDDRLPSIEFDDVYGFDDAFHQWLRGLPDLGATVKPKKSRGRPV